MADQDIHSYLMRKTCFSWTELSLPINNQANAHSPITRPTVLEPVELLVISYQYL